MALGLVLGGPMSAKLAERIGTRIVVAAGLTIVAAAMVLMSGADAGTGYGLDRRVAGPDRLRHGHDDGARNGVDHELAAARPRGSRLGDERHRAHGRRHARRGDPRKPPVQPATVPAWRAPRKDCPSPRGRRRGGLDRRRRAPWRSASAAIAGAALNQVGRERLQLGDEHHAASWPPVSRSPGRWWRSPCFRAASASAPRSGGDRPRLAARVSTGQSGGRAGAAAAPAAPWAPPQRGGPPGDPAARPWSFSARGLPRAHDRGGGRAGGRRQDHHLPALALEARAGGRGGRPDPPARSPTEDTGSIQGDFLAFQRTQISRVASGPLPRIAPRLLPNRSATASCTPPFSAS